MGGYFSDRFRDIKVIKDNWGWFLALGFLLIILGAAVISTAYYATIFSIILLGIFLCAGGIVQMIQSFLARKWSGLFLMLLLGIIYIVVGAYCIVQPEISAINLTLWIAGLCFVVGVAKMLISLILRFETWGWVFFNGLVTFVLGWIIYADWPFSGLWVIGLFVGIDMILSGLSWVILSLGARSET